jgi:ribosome-associated protein
MIRISPDRYIDDRDLSFEYIKASGPGGQNINKVSSAVRLRFDVQRNSVLNYEEKERLIKIAGSRMTDDGDLIIEARKYRTQERNRLDAINRLILLINLALIIPKTRIKTRPSKTAKAIRVNHKKKRGVVKNIRKMIIDDWE